MVNKRTYFFHFKSIWR